MVEYTTYLPILKRFRANRIERRTNIVALAVRVVESICVFHILSVRVVGHSALQVFLARTRSFVDKFV